MLLSTLQVFSVYSDLGQALGGVRRLVVGAFEFCGSIEGSVFLLAFHCDGPESLLLVLLLDRGHG